MAGNYVEIALKARDDAKPPVEDLELALKRLNHLVATALAKVDDKEAQATLLRLDSRLDAIGRRTANPKLTVEGAAKAVADLAAVDVALDKVGGKSETARVSLSGLRDSTLAADEAFIGGQSALGDYHSKLSSLSLLLRDADTDAASAAGALAAYAPAAEKAGEESASALPGIAGINPAMAGMGAAIAAAVPIVIAGGTSLAAMGGAAALAYPEIKQVMGILSGTQAAPSSGPIAQAASEIRDLESTYKQVAAQSGIGDNLISKALPSAIGTVDNLLHDMQPLAQAGAVSIDEIAKAGERVSSSSGFRGFLDDLGKQAPADTSALLDLAGSVGGDLSKAFEAAAPHIGITLAEMSGLTQELKGPLSTAVGGTVEGVGVMSGLFADAVGTASALTDAGTALWQSFASQMGSDATRKVSDFKNSLTSAHDSESALKNPGVMQFIGALTGNFSLASKGAEESAVAMGRHEAAAQRAAKEDATFGHQMDIAGGAAGTLASRVAALTTAIGNESDATATALDSESRFGLQLLATKQAMQASGDKAGYMTAKSLAAAEAFAKLYGYAKDASGGLLQTGSSAQQAAGPLIAMRNEMEQIQNPTQAERELLRELNAEIAALHSKTITIGVSVVQEGPGGQPVPVAGGPGGRIQGGPAGQAMRPGSMAMAPPSPGGGGMRPASSGPGGMPVMASHPGMPGMVVIPVEVPGAVPVSGFGPSAGTIAGRQLAAQVRQGAEQYATLTNVQSAAAKKIGSKALLSGLQADLSKIRRFNADLEKLAHLGLDKALLQDIISAGPDQGSQIAEELLHGPISRIYALNKTEREIQKASRNLGGTAGGIASGSIGGRHGPGGQPQPLSGAVNVTISAANSDGLMREFLRAVRLEVRRVGGKAPDSVQRTFGQAA